MYIYESRIKGQGMSEISILDQSNNKVGVLELPERIFEHEIRSEIINQVVKAHLAAKRVGTNTVKTKSTIRGGGKKPWRQKGTGRARAGTNRSPLWPGGAVIHGPKPRDYHKKVNKKVKHLALRMTLSSKLAEGNLFVLDKIELTRAKTKDFADIQKKLDLKKPLIVVPKKGINLDLASRNIPYAKVINQQEMHVYEILKYRELILTPEVIESLQEVL